MADSDTEEKELRREERGLRRDEREEQDLLREKRYTESRRRQDSRDDPHPIDPFMKIVIT